jgi:hypothetical protein
MTCERQTRLAAILIGVFLAGCSRSGAQTNEVVMCPGGSLVVDIGDTSFSIKSTGLLTREVTTDRLKQHITLMPRSERWFGSFGLYNPEAGDSMSHIVMEEGFQYFNSFDELQQWIASMRRELPLEYTSDGLVVAGRYQTRPPGVSEGPKSAMTIYVWRLLINDARPVGLAGANDQRFKNISLPPPTCSKPRPFAASPPKVINGRRYAGRALDFMNEQGFTPTDVEQIIKTGRRTEEGGRIMFYDSSPNHTSLIFFVDTRADGTVVQIG